MPATVFATPQNNCSTTIGAAGYTAGSGNLVLAAGGGTLLPPLSGGNYCRATVIRVATAYVPNAPASTYTIFRVTAISGDTLTLGGTLEGTTDRSYAAGDVVELRVTKGTLTDIHAAVNTLENTFTPATAATVPITSATLLTAANFGVTHLCSGTSANYTITLPPPAGPPSNAGKSLTLAMAPGLTKLVTVNPNTTETIDGAASRVMWANETATLFCDGVNWIKIAGKSIPMACAMYRNAALTLTYNANTTIPLDAVTSDNTGLMADPTTNKRITILRPGIYHVAVSVGFASITNSSNTQAILNVGGSLLAQSITGTPTGGIILIMPVVTIASLGAAVFTQLQAFHNQSGGTTVALASGPFNTFVALCEVPAW